MSFLSTFFGKGKTPPSEPLIDPSPPGDGEPFMEYPSDDYDSSLEAMTSAFERLKTSSRGDCWITFCAQGKGHDEDSCQSEDLLVRNNTLDLRGQKLDVPGLLQFGELQGQLQVQVDSEGMVTLR